MTLDAIFNNGKRYKDGYLKFKENNNNAKALWNNTQYDRMSYNEGVDW